MCDVVPKEPFQEVLNCLTNKNADVAITLSHNAKMFFNNAEYFKNYRYLCPDGNTSPPDLPCIWTEQIPRLLVTNKLVYHNVLYMYCISNTILFCFHLILTFAVHFASALFRFLSFCFLVLELSPTASISLLFRVDVVESYYYPIFF